VGRSTVDLYEYDPSWPRRFELARADLVEACGALVVAIHHIGSTAVPGLIAKPTIDIALVVSSIEDFVANVVAVERLGYEYRPTAQFHEEHLFLRRIEDDERTHHLHVISRTCRDLDDWLVLRDHLIRDPEAARRYAAVKRAAAHRHYANRGAYVEEKTPIVAELLEEARRSQPDVALSRFGSTPMSLTHTADSYLDRIATDFELARATATTDPLRYVPTTPEWNALSTFGHLAQNLAYTAWTISEDASDRDAVDHPPLRDDLDAWLSDYQAWARRGLVSFDRAVRASAARDDVPNFTGRNTTSLFWARAMCQHTTLHTWDITNAFGIPVSIDPELAAEAIHDLFDVSLAGWIVPRVGQRSAPPLRIVVTDVALDRVIALENGRPVTPASATAVLTGRASDVLLILLDRAPSDDDVVREWQAICGQ
jgi:GrpB-like predicted nucleotidyltransferase (UPF0157 family)